MYKSPVSTIAVTPFAALLQTLPADAGRKTAKLTSAQAECERLKIEAQEEGYREGYVTGFERGRDEGVAQARQELEAAHDAAIRAFESQLRAVVARVEGGMQGWYQQAEAELTPLIMEIAARVIGAELEISRESVISIVGEAMSEITHAAHARIRVNPLDLQLVSARLPQIQAIASSVKEVELVSDPSILGGCVIETDGGNVDATFVNRLQRLQDETGEAA